MLALRVVDVQRLHIFSFITIIIGKEYAIMALGYHSRIAKNTAG